ncbi:MAG: family 78 glycoside hydrolase catalytic domain [bacterium]|nr:family 78 glycoside hydrolase catalytic domain [bacterium]
MELVWVALIGVSAMAAPLEMDVFDGAQWLQDPRFENVEPVDVYHKEKDKKSAPRPCRIRNVHTLFRTEIKLEKQPVRAVAYMTADDYAKLYVNGAFVSQGPEAGYPFVYPYFQVDLAPFLTKGTNCLAAHAYYQGLINRVWNSADGRAGFMLALEVTYPKGKTERFVTNAGWRCFQLDAFPADRTIGYKTQFGEDIDMRKILVEWQSAGFDDSKWLKPAKGRQDHTFELQITPALEIARMDPVVVKKKGDGHYFYDFGTEVVGHTRVRVKGPEGHAIEVRHGEELEAPDTVRWEMRANCEYKESPILSGRDETVEFYDYRAFRYMEVLNAPAEPEVWVDVRHHPFNGDASALTASDPVLTGIWEMCKNGVRWGAQGGFLDCPSREKGQYLGDALITGHSHMTLTADRTMTKKALANFERSQRICPGIMAVAPGSFMQEIAEYSLQWPMVLRNYYWYTGDRAFTESMVDAAFDELFGYFARFESEAGLLTNMTEKWVLVDWPDNLRDGYDYDYAKTRENAVLNAFYYASLCTAADLLDDLGRDASAYRTKAEHVKAAYADRLLSAETGLFVDAPGSKHSSLHANALPLAFGLAPEQSVPAIMDLIREKRLSCGVYIAPFIIQACYQGGDPALAYDLITSKDEHSWHEMLKAGATTCMEAWGPEQKWNTSWCHPWSSGPIYLVAEHVFGLMPAAPGWSKVGFTPRVPESLDHFAYEMPIQRGSLGIVYERGKGFIVSAPPGVEVVADVADGVDVVVQTSMGIPLGREQHQRLDNAGWHHRVDGGRAVWVSVAEQMLRVVEDGRVLWQAPCSTASAGTGSKKDSNQTPLGWHSVAEKIGDGAPLGQVFESRAATKECWQPGQVSDKDMVLTRILWLAGEEPELNKGGRVDSYHRYIYIHGTNGENLIGTPASHGCIRLLNDDVIVAYDLIPVDAPVVITEF